MKKTYTIISLISFVAGTFFCHGQNITVRGYVHDSLQTVPYASVYMKNNPSNGTLTSADGTFTMTVDRALLPDSLVISFVGYHGFILPMAASSADTLSVNALLRENVIELPGVQVVSKKRKKNRKVEMASLLAEIRSQLDRDFENIEALYRIQTNTSISSSDKILAYQESLVDVYEKSRRDKDMVRRIETKVYFDKLAQERMQKTDSLKNIDPTTNIKGLTVTEGMIRNFLGENPKKWEYVGQEGSDHVLSYYDRIGFLGMFSFSVKCVLYVDKVSYSVTKCDAIMGIYLNIPFGKKLPPDFMPYLNILNVSDREMDKFRLRRAEGEFRMSTHFVKSGESVYRGDSYSYGKALIKSPKQSLVISLRSDMKILDTKTSDITPITHEQTLEKPNLIIIDSL